MMVVISDRMPPRLRGLLQLWLLEPKPGVFLGSVNKSVEKYLMEFIQPYLSQGSGILVARDDNSRVQGFSVAVTGQMNRKIVDRTGVSLVSRIGD